MRSINMALEGSVAILWDKEATGANTALNKAVVTFLTRRGTDKINERGNDLEQRVFSGSVYDTLSAQHELNFAALETQSNCRKYLTGDPISDVTSMRALLSSVASGRIQAKLSITCDDGTVIGTTTQI